MVNKNSTKIIGIWVQKYDNTYYKNCYAVNNRFCNTVCPFETIQHNVDLDLKSLNKNVRNIWLTLGGDDQNKDIPINSIFKILKKYQKINGIIFDMEGWLKNDYVKIIKYIRQIQKLNIKRKLLLILAPLGDTNPPNKSILSKFDYVAPLMYYGINSYSIWGFNDRKYNLHRIMPENWTNINKCAEIWSKSVGDKSKILLTVQSSSATHANCILLGIKKLLNSENYGGFLLWPSIPQNYYDFLNLKILCK